MNLKTLPLVRHIRAYVFATRVIWKAMWIWHVTTIEEIESLGFYNKDLDLADDIFRGKA